MQKTIVSIFVNPTQFNNKLDYNRYPRNRKKDLSILKRLKVDFVFLPNKKISTIQKEKLKFLKKTRFYVQNIEKVILKE